jgi:hypothetical protein
VVQHEQPARLSRGRPFEERQLVDPVQVASLSSAVREARKPIAATLLQLSSPGRSAARSRLLRAALRLDAGLRLLEVLMDEGDRHAPLSDRGRDALDRPEADVAAREDARHARLQQVWIALEVPPVGGP